MPDRDDVALAGEDVRLSELDVGIDEPCRPQHHEYRITVDVELRALMGAERVLDGEFVQPELSLKDP